MPCEGGCFSSHAFHEIAVAHQPVGAMIDNIESGPVIARGKMRLRHGHAHPIGESLAERSGGDLDTRRQAAFRMSGSEAAPLAELLELFHRHLITGQVQQAV